RPPGRRTASAPRRGAVPALERRVPTTVGDGRQVDTSKELTAVAQRVADALPADVAEEVVLTGSVSRGVADEVSDIEMLIVTPQALELAACFEHARAAGLKALDTWGNQSTPAKRVSGFLDGVPLE